MHLREGSAGPLDVLGECVAGSEQHRAIDLEHGVDGGQGVVSGSAAERLERGLDRNETLPRRVGAPELRDRARQVANFALQGAFARLDA